MLNNINAQSQWLGAMKALVKSTELQVQPPLLKLGRMQEIYLAANSHLYTSSQILHIDKQLQAVQFRYKSTSLTLEQLWALSMTLQLRSIDIVEKQTDVNLWQDEEMTIGLTVLESFLFHARSFLDMYMLYICLIFGMEKPVLMSTSDFKKFKKSITQPALQLKAEYIWSYFDNSVLADNAWGDTLRSLRDKITHKEPLRPSQKEDISLVGRELIWPVIRKLPFSDIAQEFKNGIFETLRDTAPVLFDLEWKVGPYKPDLWK